MVGSFHFKAPAGAQVLRLYAVGDLHVGSPDCDPDGVVRLIKTINNDDCACVVYLGDLIDCALAGSPSNVYKQTSSPGDQIEMVAEFFRKQVEQGKILAMMDGNHEGRLVRSVGVSPTSIITKILDIPHLYTPTTAIIRLDIGDRVYSVYATHGSGGGATIGAKANALERLTRIVDADIYLSGHTHEPILFWRDFVRMDPATGTETMTTRIFANCGSCLKYRGSYGDGRYAPAAYGYPVISLYADGRPPEAKLFI